MRRTLTAALLAMLLLFAGCAEETVPGKIAEACGLLSRCPDLTSFEGAPKGALAAEFLASFRAAHPEDPRADGEILTDFFVPAEGAEEEADQTEAAVDAFELLDSVSFCEDPVETGLGLVKYTLRVETDFGNGYEFSFFAEVFTDPATERIVKVFFSE